MSDGVLQSLGINGKLFFAQLVNFAIVMIVVWKWVYQPLLKAMDKRQKKIGDGLLYAEQAKQELAEAQHAQELLLKKARQEAQGLIRSAEEQGKKDRQELIIKTQNDLERMMVENKARLDQEERAMMLAVKKQSADLIVQALEKILPSVLDDRTKRASLEKTMNELV
ncbi:MAG: F0F1 ATP synthase subunit B [Candidatus Uhrbacteria bacterium]|nr:F0F1 ATP synthase subunit B [Candidatus Uhrbacteria bacterium]